MNVNLNNFLKKKSRSLIVFLFCSFSYPVFGKDLEKGKQLFEANCNVCHIKGKNIIIPEKGLERLTLQLNGILNKEAIIYQIINGKNGMPAFGGRLTKNEIDEIAEYVLIQFR